MWRHMPDLQCPSYAHHMASPAKTDTACVPRSYGEALAMAPMASQARPRLLANRALAFTKAARFVDALTDADAVVAAAPAWDKGHWRRGAALAGLKRAPEAVAAYHRAWQLSKGASGTASYAAQPQI